MKNYVITIFDNPRSVEMAERCIRSAAEFRMTIEKFKAITPKDDPEIIAASEGIPTAKFHEKYSRYENCLSAFLSHYSLWKKSIEMNESVRIFEHDAVLKYKIPQILNKETDTALCINLGKPSYGRFNVPSKRRIGPLVSKKYFPGAHGYQVSPKAAKLLVEKAKKAAGPTDVFLNVVNFPWLKEFYPWPVVAKDTFTTIQNDMGCKAKHNYGEKYEII